MQPRPRLVCREPGLRPIDLNLFNSIHFYFFYSSLGLVGNMQGCQHAQCPLPLSIAIRMRLVTRQSQLPACLAGPWEHSPGIYATGLVKFKDKIDEICINGKFSIEEPSECRFFCIPVSNFTVFRLESRLVPAVLELGQVRLFWKLIR